jgi:hypothetical protein
VCWVMVTAMVMVILFDLSVLLISVCVQSLLVHLNYLETWGVGDFVGCEQGLLSFAIFLLIFNNGAGTLHYCCILH